MSKNQAIAIVKNYANQLQADNFSFARVYLFGSCARGTNRTDSDIDVAVVSNRLRKFEDSFVLRRARRAVDTRIEPHGFTVKDFNDKNNPMVNEIKKTGIRIV